MFMSMLYNHKSNNGCWMHRLGSKRIERYSVQSATKSFIQVWACDRRTLNCNTSEQRSRRLDHCFPIQTDGSLQNHWSTRCQVWSLWLPKLMQIHRSRIKGKKKNILLRGSLNPKVKSHYIPLEPVGGPPVFSLVFSYQNTCSPTLGWLKRGWTCVEYCMECLERNGTIPWYLRLSTLLRHPPEDLLQSGIFFASPHWDDLDDTSERRSAWFRQKNIEYVHKNCRRWIEYTLQEQ